MKITDIISEATIGTEPKRPSREGSRPERGHEPQKRYVTDRKTGKQYNPDEEFDKTMNSPEVKAQMKRMAQKEGVAEGNDKDDAPYTPSPAKPSRNPAGFNKKGTGVGNKLADLNRKEMEKLQQKKQQGVAEGLSDVVKGVKRAVKGKDHPDVVAARHMGRAMGHYNQGDMNAGNKESQRYVKTRDMHLKAQGVAEGEVVAFPKKHKADLSSVHSCVKCGGDLQGGKYMGHEVKVCMPCKQVYLPPNSGIDQKGDRIKEQIAAIEAELAEAGKASKALCISSRPDSDLGASNLASCKSQGLRARDGEKSHKLGKSAKSRIKVGGHKIKGNKYGGPLPDWS